MLKGLVVFGLTRRPIILLALLVFVGAGIFAFFKLNIEAYPNPAPVILEITAQAPGLSAEEMERYYTIPMEVGLSRTPGVDIIRSTSFYGLVVRPRHLLLRHRLLLRRTAGSAEPAAERHAAQRRVTRRFRRSSLVGEIYRYQLVGPPHFGLTNLRTLQDWVLQRRFLTVPGVVQVNTWGGTTKEYEVEVDPHKLEAYNITVPQLLAALGNANINVGGRTIQFGQQSVNIRGVGLIDSGGTADLTKGFKVNDIENIVLSPGERRRRCRSGRGHGVSVGYVPRLGKAGRDNEDDVVAAIVVMNRTLHTNDVLARIKREVENINSDGSLPPGVKIVPFYDRRRSSHVTTHTVLHNLIFGCLLVFLIQWIFLGDLRSAIIVGVNIPFALFFSIIILVVTGEIGQPAVARRGRLRHHRRFGRDPGGERIPQLPDQPDERPTVLDCSHEDTVSTRSRPARHLVGPIGPIDCDCYSDQRASQVDRAVLFSTAITVAAFVPLFTMQGVEGQIFGPMARTYGYALAGALIATFTVTPVLASLLLPKHVKEVETLVVRGCARSIRPRCDWALTHAHDASRLGVGIPRLVGLLIAAARQRIPAGARGRQSLDSRHDAADDLARSRRCRGHADARDPAQHPPEVITVVSQHGRPDDGSDASGFYNVELFCRSSPSTSGRPA